MDLSDDFRLTLAHLLPSFPAVKLAVAYSGGVDSQVLLHLAYQLSLTHPNIQLRALHVNHGISDNATFWAKHCSDYCNALGIAFELRQLTLQKQAQQSLEADAREARYQALADMLLDDEVLLLGQHSQDQIETFLLQLKRGAGPKGLSSMAACGDMPVGGASIRFARPLLHVDKQHIVSYAKQERLSWQDDESNQDTQFDRNFIRHHVMPLLAQRWPGFHSAANRSIAHIAEQELMLQDVTQVRFEQCLNANGSLCLLRLGQISKPWQKRIVRTWIEHSARVSKSELPLTMPSQKVLSQVFDTLIHAKTDANPKVQHGQWQFRRFQRKLYLVQAFDSLKSFQWTWSGEPVYEVDSGLGRFLFATSSKDHCVSIEYERPSEGGESALLVEAKLTVKASAAISVRFSGYGARFKPAGSHLSKPIKQWFKLWNIPPWERERIALLFVDDRIVMVGGIVSADFSD